MMCEDAVTNVRYNAATGMARHGDARSMEILIEMVDRDQSQAVDGEREESAREWKRNSVILNGLRASEQLARANQTADLEKLQMAVQSLLKTGTNGHLQAAARRTLEQFEKRQNNQE